MGHTWGTRGMENAVNRCMLQYIGTRSLRAASARSKTVIIVRKRVTIDSLHCPIANSFGVSSRRALTIGSQRGGTFSSQLWSYASMNVLEIVGLLTVTVLILRTDP
jgi:hypothetical protein